MVVDLSALRDNLALVRHCAGPREVIASIKANAYGLGVVGIAQALVDAGVEKLWTGNPDEAVALREAGITAQILLFGGVRPKHFPVLLAYDLQPTLFEDQSAELLAAAALAAGKRARVWVKVDAGLGRLGVPLEQAGAFIRRLASEPALELRGVYTHLPFASQDGRAWAIDRYSAFKQLTVDLAQSGVSIPVTQAWGSSGLLSGAPDSSTAVCVGHALYGLSPLTPELASRKELKPLVKSLSADIIRVDYATESTSQAGGYALSKRRRPATVAIGLGDGLRPAASGHSARVIAGGRCVPVAAFTLEHLMIDLGGENCAALFDQATIVGRVGHAEITLDDWAHWTGASPLELMMSLSGRIPVVHEE
nr:alanine racemase [Qipengyuania qiaonensis]